MNNPFAQALAGALSYAIVSHQVSRDGDAVGFLYREAAAFEQDSGWRIFSGAEDDDYVNHPNHFDTVLLGDVLATNPDIKHLMSETNGAWEWHDETQAFVAVTDWQPID